MSCAGFIVPEIYEGGTEFILKNRRQRSKKGIKRYNYIPAQGIESSQKFEDYFDPAKETILIGMVRKLENNTNELRSFYYFYQSKFHLQEQRTNKTEQRNLLQVRDQTDRGLGNQANKRKEDNYVGPSKKRIKVSITEAINLQE